MAKRMISTKRRSEKRKEEEEELRKLRREAEVWKYINKRKKRGFERKLEE